MTLPEAIRALFDDFDLESCVDIIREDVQHDDTWTGLSWEHPKVLRFREACRTLRAEIGPPPPEQQP